MHDEVGMFEFDEHDTPLVEPEFIEEFEEGQTTVSAAPELLSETGPNGTFDEGIRNGSLEPNGANQTQNRRKIVDALEGIQRNRTGIKQDYPLNAALLSLLTPHEIEIISVANERRFSPSDSELCTQLNIKRSRLSQISNRLHQRWNLKRSTDWT